MNNLPDFTQFATMSVPGFAGAFILGWMACKKYLVTPLEKRVETLEDRDEAYRKGVDEELRAYRNQRVPG